jgi:hypothetical protein
MIKFFKSIVCLVFGHKWECDWIKTKNTGVYVGKDCTCKRCGKKDIK